MFFDKGRHLQIKRNVYEYYNIKDEDKIVCYAPTFRGSYSLDCYKIDWEKILPAFEQMLKGNVHVLIRLHPNFLDSNTNRASLFNSPKLHDATSYNDINDLIIASDVMISDYSSCMFDFAFTERPCFIYAVDSDKYERGFYLKLRELPFPFSSNSDELLHSISNFDYNDYHMKLKYCMKNVFGSFDKGDAAKEVVDWMLKKSIGFTS